MSAQAASDRVEILDLVMLFDETVEKQAEDLKKMSAENVADIHMVSFFLVPEGNPPFDKISLYDGNHIAGNPRARLRA